MDRSGPGPSGLGPDPVALEAARLRVYRPDASAEDRAAYTRLLDAQSRELVEAEVRRAQALPADTEPAAPLEPRVARPRWRVRAAIAGTAVVVAALVVVVLLPRGPEPLPDFLLPPSTKGMSLVTIGRQSDPRTAPDRITYTPEGYTVFQPEGRAVQVGLRCQGAGTVVIAAGRRFVFHCGVREAVLRLGGQATSTPFVVVGTTRGNVVWAARISLL